MTLTTQTPNRAPPQAGFAAAPLLAPGPGAGVSRSAATRLVPPGLIAAGLAAPDGAQPGMAAERRLLDAAERAMRAPAGRIAMALHLSRLKTPSPRPYNARIALALMQDTAQRLGGQVFPLSNGDLVMICAAPAEPARPGRPAPQSLADSLGGLFGFDMEEATSLWRLDEEAGAFRDYIRQRQEDASRDARQEDASRNARQDDASRNARHDDASRNARQDDSPREARQHDASRHARQDEAAPASGLAALMARLSGIDPRQILMQQTAIALLPGAGLPLSARLRPLYREVRLAPVPPQASEDASLLADPFIRRHAAGALEGRVLALITSDLREGGTLTRPCLALGMPMHIDLSPEAIVSPGFARLAQEARRRGARLAVELGAMDIAADPELTVFACRLLAQTGVGVVLDGIDHAGLAMIDTAALAPELVKLTWSPRLAEGPRPLLEPVEAAIAAIGPARIVLDGADGEAALSWGQSRGITRYQGPFVDAVQAAGRIAICHSARVCTLRQCTGRAQALSPAPRAGCGNPGLLDLSGVWPHA